MPLLNRWVVATGVDDLFVRHYAQLLEWARQLVGGDRWAAEDLVHDTFIRVSLRNPDLRAIANIEGYLFVTMRNVHLSQVRRRAARPVEVTSFVDHESLVASLAAARAGQRRQAAHAELTRIAEFACLRKATSRGASAFILRFFHGYYPAEIARVLATSEAAVDTRLRMARVEVRTFLADPDRLKSFHHRVVAPLLDASSLDADDADEADIVASLRRSIFDSRADDCLPADHLNGLYDDAGADPIDTRVAAHIVSCAGCLDVLNRRFGFPLLSDRDPSDMHGRGGRSGGGPRGGAPAGSGPRVTLRTRLDDVLEERPKELRIAVNGLFVGSQAVTGGVSEQRVRVLVSERIGFIEVFSEHGVCLLYLDIEPPPDGPAEQSVRVPLSDGRRLSATLTFHDSGPVLDVAYEDPSWGHAPAVTARTTSDALASSVRLTLGDRLRGLFRRHAPVALATLLTALVAVAVAYWNRTPPVAPMSAAEVLRGANEVESALPPGMATRRLITVEERLVATSEVVRVQRLELWRDASRGIKVQRLFDDRRQIVAGIWTKADGTRTVYRPGTRPVVQAASQPTGPVTSSNIWTHEPSADDFVKLVGPSIDPVLEERQDSYVLTYQAAAPATSGVIGATLVIAKSGHHATAETVTLREDGQARQFTLIETGIERLPSSTIAANVFEPEPVLTGVPPGPAVALSAPPPLPPVPARPALSAAELDKLELDATYRLYRARVWLGQRAAIVRAPDGVHVDTVVSSDELQSTVTRSFEELAGNPAVTLNVRVESGDASALESGPVTMMPAYAALRPFFAASISDVSRDDAIRSLAASVRESIQRREERLKALQTLIDLWPEGRLNQLSLGSVVTWQLMVQDHADAVRQQTALLRGQLAAWFAAGPTSPGPGRGALPSLSTVSAAAATVGGMAAMAAEQDDALETAFTPCTSGSCPALDINRVLQSFAGLESVASAFGRFYLKVGRGSTP